MGSDMYLTVFPFFVFLCSKKTKLDFHFRFPFFPVGKETEFEFI